MKLAETAYDLRLDFKRLTVKVADRAVKLSLREFFVYALFAYYRKNGFGENGFTGLHKISREHLDKVCRLISKAKGAEKGFEDFELLPKAEFIYSLDVESLRDKSEDDGERIGVAVAREKIVDTLRQVLGKITPKMAKSFMPEEFDIERRGEKEAFIFGLKIEPERIKFE